MELPPPDRKPRRDELASRSDEAVIAVVQTIVGAVMGVEGAIIAAVLSPFAKWAAERLRGLTVALEEAGIDTEAVARHLEEDEARARLIADVVRGTVESDLAAKRKLLAKSAVRAFEDLAVSIDREQRLIRAVNMLDTFDIRVLSFASHPPERSPDFGGVSGSIVPNDLATMWPEDREFALASISTLMAAGVIDTLHGFGDTAGWRVTDFGRRLLDTLEAEGLEEELASRY